MADGAARHGTGTGCENNTAAVERFRFLFVYFLRPELIGGGFLDQSNCFLDT